MMTFLAGASLNKWQVQTYRDHAQGFLEENQAGRMVAAGKNDLRLKNDPVHHDPSRWFFFEESLGLVSIALKLPFIQ